MKFLGKQLTENNKGYFGVRRCTICKDKLRDVNLVEIYATNYFCFIPIKSVLLKRILVCQDCKAYMELDNKLWEYYATYYNSRFDKNVTDNIINTLNDLSSSITQNGVNLSITDTTSQQALDLIYNSLVKKYHNHQNIEEIVSVYYK
jgi:hypothetical protein